MPRSSLTLKILGTLRRLCEDCSRIDEQEIELQGRLRELLRYMTWEGTVPKKYHRQVDRLGRHRFAKISSLASEMLKETEFQREMSAARREHEAELLESIATQHDSWVEGRTQRLGEELAGYF